MAGSRPMSSGESGFFTAEKASANVLDVSSAVSISTWSCPALSLATAKACCLADSIARSLALIVVKATNDTMVIKLHAPTASPSFVVIDLRFMISSPSSLFSIQCCGKSYIHSLDRLLSSLRCLHNLRWEFQFHFFHCPSVYKKAGDRICLNRNILDLFPPHDNVNN